MYEPNNTSMDYWRDQRLRVLQLQMGMPSSGSSVWREIFSHDDIDTYAWLQGPSTTTWARQRLGQSVELLGRYVQHMMEPGLHRVVLFAHPSHHGQILLHHEQDCPEVCPFQRNVPMLNLADHLLHLKSAEDIAIEADTMLTMHRGALKDLLWNMRKHHDQFSDEQPSAIEGTTRIHAWISGQTEPMIKAAPRCSGIENPELLSRQERIDDKALRDAYTHWLQVSTWKNERTIVFGCMICGAASHANSTCKACHRPICQDCAQVHMEVAGKALCMHCWKQLCDSLKGFPGNARDRLQEYIRRRMVGNYLPWPTSEYNANMHRVEYSDPLAAVRQDLRGEPQAKVDNDPGGKI